LVVVGKSRVAWEVEEGYFALELELKLEWE